MGEILVRDTASNLLSFNKSQIIKMYIWRKCWWWIRTGPAPSPRPGPGLSHASPTSYQEKSQISHYCIGFECETTIKNKTINVKAFDFVCLSVLCTLGEVMQDSKQPDSCFFPLESCFFVTKLKKALQYEVLWVFRPQWRVMILEWSL